MDIEPVPQSCSLQRQLDRYMATLPSVNPGALSYALRSFLGEVLSGAQRVSSPMVAPTTRSILVQRQLCTAVSKPFISQKRLPVDLVFIYVSKYIAGSLLFCFPSLPLFLLLPSPLSLTPPLSLSLSLSLVLVTPRDQDSGFCMHAVGEALQVKYRYSRLREFSTRRVDETKIDTVVPRLIFFNGGRAESSLPSLRFTAYIAPSILAFDSKDHPLLAGYLLSSPKQFRTVDFDSWLETRFNVCAGFPGRHKGNFWEMRSREHKVGKYAVWKYKVGKYAVWKYKIGKYVVWKHEIGKYILWKYKVGKYAVWKQLNT